MHFSAKKLRAVCSLCAQDIEAGETMWCVNGLTVCADCFPGFARAELAPYELICGERPRGTGFCTKEDHNDLI